MSEKVKKILDTSNDELDLPYVIFKGSDTKAAFEAGWSAAIKEIETEIAWRRNESTWVEYNEALDDISSFIDSLEAKGKEE